MVSVKIHHSEAKKKNSKSKTIKSEKLLDISKSLPPFPNRNRLYIFKIVDYLSFLGTLNPYEVVIFCSIMESGLRRLKK